MPGSTVGTSGLIETKIILALSVGLGAAIAGVAAAAQDLSPVEDRPVLWLLSVVILGIGGGTLKMVYDLNKNVGANTIAVTSLASSIATLVNQNQTANRDYATARDAAVATVTGKADATEHKMIERMDKLERDIIREFERRDRDRGSTGPKE